MKHVSKLFCLSILLFGLNSCNPTASLIEGGLFSSNWVLDQLPGVDLDSFMGGLPNLNFNKEDMVISGSDGCNNFTGNFGFDKGNLDLGNLATTKKACPGNSPDKFMDALQNTEKLSIEDGKLLLKQGKETLASFVKG